MKKIITSASLIAIGATSLHAQYAPGLSPVEQGKPWSVSASLRGFYDDNYNTAPSNLADESFGFEVSPSISLNLALQQTFIGLSYVYSGRFYESRPDEDWDHTHQINAKLDHAFSERYKIELGNSFVIAQEPEIISGDGPAATFLRTEGDNIRNTAQATLTTQLTQVLGLQLGYENRYFNYEQDGPDSRSALLDRLEHLGRVNLRWQVLRPTVAIVGYQYGVVDYTSDDLLNAPGGPFSPDIRDNRSHYAYVGADHTFNPRLSASARVGAQYTEYHRAPNDPDSVNPYVDAAVTYRYLQGSYVQAGIRHSRVATDVFAFGGGLTLDQEATAVYASITHRITSRLTASLLGQFQNSTFEVQGVGSDPDEQFYTVGLNLGYRINPHLLAEAGYNYDNLESDIGGRDYDRNRVYVGLRATY